MKDSQHQNQEEREGGKYIKANNERFSTAAGDSVARLSISRRIMKDSQPKTSDATRTRKYIKANNERFSTGIYTPRRRS